MSRCSEIVKQDTPRLVIKYKHEAGNEMFDWGVVGELPSLSLVGYIVQLEREIQAKLYIEEHDCPEPALVVMWNTKDREFDWFLHPDIPLDPLVGMLELVKTNVLTTYIIRQSQQVQKTAVLGLDGRPIRVMQ